MNIKSYIVLAVAALTAACNQVETVDVPVDENAATQVELNDDGSVKEANATEEAVK